MKLVSIILVLSVLFCCDTPKKAEEKEAEIVKQEESEIVKQEEPEYIEISLPTLINDVINGGLFYEDKRVKIRARVKKIGKIETFRPNVHIYISGMGLEHEVGKNHTMKLHIHKIDYTHLIRSTNWHIHAKVED